MSADAALTIRFVVLWDRSCRLIRTSSVARLFASDRLSSAHRIRDAALIKHYFVVVRDACDQCPTRSIAARLRSIATSGPVIDFHCDLDFNSTFPDNMIIGCALKWVCILFVTQMSMF